MESAQQRINQNDDHLLYAEEPLLGNVELPSQQIEAEHIVVTQQPISTPDCLKQHYRFIEHIGQGAQANVYKALRFSDNQFVAVKQLRIDSVANWKEYDLFNREADVLAKLRMKGVAQFYEAVEQLSGDKPSAFIIQQYIRGRALSEMMKSGYRFTVNAIFKLALQLLDILEQLHKHDPVVIHRDIKPSNIMLQPLEGDEYELYLIDFGAVANPIVQKGGSTVAGTYGYMPPEQLVGRPVPSSDTYAMGAMLAYMLSGVEPGNMRVADFRLIIDPHLQNIPRSIVRVLQQMLDPDPEKRLSDYEKLRGIFDNFMHDNYIISSTDNVSRKDLKKRLSKVRRINQPGNLDLWMAFPEKTPRSRFDKDLKRMLHLPEKVYRNVYASTKADLRLKKLIKAIIEIVLLSVCFMVIWCPVLLCISWVLEKYYLWKLSIGINEGVIIASILSVVSSIVFGCFNKNTELHRYAVAWIKAFKTLKSVYNSNHENYDYVKKLYRYGRKTIATVVDCSYKPVSKENDAFTEFAGMDHQINLAYYYAPTYIIRYRFNPPDDSSPNDLIHVIEMHTDATVELDPGAPITILYYINPDDNRDVISMPYPLTNDPELTIGEIVGHSVDMGNNIKSQSSTKSNSKQTLISM